MKYLDIYHSILKCNRFLLIFLNICFCTFFFFKKAECEHYDNEECFFKKIIGKHSIFNVSLIDLSIDLYTETIQCNDVIE